MKNINFKYKIGDKHNSLTILSKPYKVNIKSKRYFVDLRCDCGKEFRRGTRNFNNAKTCKSCQARKNVQKVIAKQQIKYIPIGSKFGHLTVSGKCFKYKSCRKLPVTCDCGLKYEIFKKDWERTTSCRKCREQYKHKIEYDDINHTKKCSICSKIKPLSQFGTDSKNKTNGKRADCKECQSFTQKAYKFGLTRKQLEDIISQQNNKCLICGMEFKYYSEWCVDHDHHTGKIRGVLCSNCNSGLGFFYDNEQFLSNAINYLRKNN